MAPQTIINKPNPTFEVNHISNASISRNILEDASFVYEIRKYVENRVQEYVRNRHNPSNVTPYETEIVTQHYLPTIIDNLGMMRFFLQTEYCHKLIRIGAFTETKLINYYVKKHYSLLDEKIFSVLYHFGNLLNLDDEAAGLVFKNTLYLDSFSETGYDFLLSNLCTRIWANKDSIGFKTFMKKLNIKHSSEAIDHWKWELLQSIHTDTQLGASVLQAVNLLAEQEKTINSQLLKHLTNKCEQFFTHPSTNNPSYALDTQVYCAAFLAYNNYVNISVQKTARQFLKKTDNTHYLKDAIKIGLATNLADLLTEHPVLEPNVLVFMVRNFYPIPASFTSRIEDFNESIIYIPGEGLGEEHYLRNQYLVFRDRKEQLPTELWETILEEMTSVLIKVNELDNDAILPEAWVLSVCNTMFST